MHSIPAPREAPPISPLPAYLIEVHCLVEAFLAEGGQVDETFPLLVDLVDALLNLLCAEIASRNEIVAHLEHGLQVSVSGRHLILHVLVGRRRL